MRRDVCMRLRYLACDTIHSLFFFPRNFTHFTATYPYTRWQAGSEPPATLATPGYRSQTTRPTAL